MAPPVSGKVAAGAVTTSGSSGPTVATQPSIPSETDLKEATLDTSTGEQTLMSSSTTEDWTSERKLASSLLVLQQMDSKVSRYDEPFQPHVRGIY